MKRLVTVGIAGVLVLGLTAATGSARPGETARGHGGVGTTGVDRQRPPKPPPPRVRGVPRNFVASSGWTVNTGWVWMSGSSLLRVSSAYAGVASKAIAACGASSPIGDAASGLLTQALRFGAKLNVATTLWTAVAWWGLSRLSGISPCTVARQTANAAYWTARYYAAGDGMWTWFLIFQEDRTLQPDRCYAWHNFHPRGWLIERLTSVVAPGSGGCPRG